MTDRIIIFFISLLLCIWIFLSGIDISGKVIYLLCFGLEVILFISSGLKLHIRIQHIMFFNALLLMLLYSKNMSAKVIAFDLTYMIFVFLLVISNRINLESNVYSVVLNTLVGFSLFTVIFLCCEFFFPNTMTVVLKFLLSGERLTEELQAISNHTLYSALASFGNVITYSVIILLAYSIFLNPHVYIKMIIISTSIFAVFILGERSDIVFMPLSLMLTYYCQSDKKKISRGVMVIILILVAGGLFYIFQPLLIQFRMFERVFSSIDKYNSGGDITGGRSKLYSRAIELWKNNVLMGNGWYYFYNSNKGILRPNKFSHVHNLILELLCDCGLIGLCIIIAPMIYSFVLNIKELKKETDWKKGVYKFTLTVQTFFFLDSMLHVTFYGISLMSIYFFVILIFSLTKQEKRYSILQNGAS